VHFSFIASNGEADAASPVIVSVPNSGVDPADANFVVGADLRAFLRFGFHRGFFALEQLGFHRDLTLEVYASAEWRPTESWHKAVGFEPLSEPARRVRDLLTARFELTPLSYTTEQFQELQDRYKPLLEYLSEDEW
jgi:hypothetical protein